MVPAGWRLTWRVFGAVLLVLLLVPLGASPSAAGLGGDADQARRGYTISDQRYRSAGGAANPTGSGRPVEYRVELAPERCTVTDAQIGACVPGQVNCPGHPRDAANDWRLAETFWRETGTTAWFSLGRECLNYAAIAPAVSPRDARAEILRRLPRTSLQLSPAARGVVNLPEIVSAGPAGQLIFAVSIFGQPVTLRATGERYDWDFGDGTTLTADVPGRPYQPGTSCTITACAGYLSHPYRHPGSYPIRLTITWHGEFSVGGAAWQDIPARIAVPGAPVLLPVVETQVPTGR